MVAQRLCDLLNHGITPIVPMRGSVGASGDLAPLAHIAVVLIAKAKQSIVANADPRASACNEKASSLLRFRRRKESPC